MSIITENKTAEHLAPVHQIKKTYFVIPHDGESRALNLLYLN